jgi:SAM-dependent methyltransferase
VLGVFARAAVPILAHFRQGGRVSFRFLIEERHVGILTGFLLLSEPPRCAAVEKAAGILGGVNYQDRLAAEKAFFEDCTNVHELPDIFHYWSNGKIRPQQEVFGFSSPNGMFEKYLSEHCERGRGRTQRFVSIGSGNCDLEIELARALLRRGHDRFIIECLDLNPAMLERGRAVAEREEIGQWIEFQEGDFNEWQPQHEYDAVIANQSLHHVLNLEGLFSRIQENLRPGGRFVISDMIGRNGHQLWPEALEIVQEFWKELPPSYRFNNLLQRHEEVFDNWDCSQEGFEGIRAQDILPLLLGRVHFEFFFAFGNVIDPFVSRSFGHNFNASGRWDREFIDRLHRCDQQEMLAGNIKPTHMVAVAGNDRDVPRVFAEPFSPEFCVRWPDPQTIGTDLLVARRGALLEAQLTELRVEMDSLRAELQRLDGVEARLCTAENQLRGVAESRWVNLGNRIGLGPKVR